MLVEWPAARDDESGDIKWFRYRKMAIQMGKQIPPRIDFTRADGNTHCMYCGLKLIDHPVCSDGLLHIGCDGRLWKL